MRRCKWKQRAEWLRKEVLWLFLFHPIMGFFTGTAETRPDEHLFHMMRSHVAAIPTGAKSFFVRLILTSIEREKNVTFYSAPWGS